MKGRLGLNGATLPRADLLTGIRSAAGAGFAYYEPRLPELVGSEGQTPATDVRSVLAEAGVDWLPLNGLEDVFAGSADRLAEEARRIFALAAPFGVKTVIVVPGSVPRAVDRSEAVRVLERLKGMAEVYGISLFYEFIGFNHHAFPLLEEARSLTAEAGLPLVLDTFHLAVSQTSRSSIEGLEASEIGLVHLSDAYVKGDDVTRMGDADRVLPGEGQLPLAEILAAILTTGYVGPISVEVFHPKYGELVPGEVARDAYERATSLLSQVEEGRSLRGEAE